MSQQTIADLAAERDHLSRQEARTLYWVAAACAILIYVVPLFLRTPLLDPDEGLHASIAQEMVERGKYLMPRLLGKPFLDKPVLYFWFEALSLRLFGMNEFAVRLPGLLFGFLSALTTGMLAKSLFGRRVGLMATLIAIAMPLVLIIAQAATHDVALVAWTNLVLLCLWETNHRATGRKQMLFMYGAGIGIGLTILTKGLLGVALIALAYGLSVLLSRRLSMAIVVRSFSALFLGMVIAAPWYLAAESQVPGYLHYYFVERHFHAFTSTTQIHGHQPFYYYLPYVCLGSLPWCWYLLPLLRRERARLFEGRLSPQLLLLVSWLFGGLLFLSIAKSKLLTYALPLFPAIAILAAVAWQRFIAARKRQIEQNGSTAQSQPRLQSGCDPQDEAFDGFDARLFAGLFCLAIVPGVIAPPATLLFVKYCFGISSGPLTWCAIALSSALTFVGWRLFRRGLPTAALAMIALWIALFLVGIMIGPAQSFARRYSSQSIATWLNERGALPNDIVLVGDRIGSLVFYLNPSARRQLQSDQIRRASIVDLARMSKLRSDVMIVIDEGEYRNAQKWGIQFDAAEWETPGGQHVIVGPGEIYKQKSSQQLSNLARAQRQHD